MASKCDVHSRVRRTLSTRRRRLWPAERLGSGDSALATDLSRATPAFEPSNHPWPTAVGPTVVADCKLPPFASPSLLAPKRVRPTSDGRHVRSRITNLTPENYANSTRRQLRNGRNCVKSAEKLVELFVNIPIGSRQTGCA